MRVQKIGQMIETALAHYDKIKSAQDVWAAEENLAEYLEKIERNLDENEWSYFDEIFTVMKKLRDAIPEFVDRAWESIMYKNHKGRLYLFENGYVGDLHDVGAPNTASLYSTPLDWFEWQHSALANQVGSKKFEVENDFKNELMRHLLNEVLNDYLEMRLDRIIDDFYSRRGKHE